MTDFVSLLDASRNPIVFVDSDLDGTGARLMFAFYAALRERVSLDFVSTSTGNLVSDYESVLGSEFYSGAHRHDLIIACDLVPEIDMIKAVQDRLTIFDHHKSNNTFIKNNNLTPANYYYHEKKSSTKLVYEKLQAIFPDNLCIKKFAALVNLYDLWKSEHRDFELARNINLLLWYYKRTFGNSGLDVFIELHLKKFYDWKHYDFTADEYNIIKEERAKENAELKKALGKVIIRKDNRGCAYAYIEHSRKLSLIAHHLLSTNPDITYVLALNTFLPQQHKFSLRSRKGFSVLPLAVQHEGGGHKQAAGFTLNDPETFQDLTLGIRHLQ